MSDWLRYSVPAICSIALLDASLMHPLIFSDDTETPVAIVAGTALGAGNVMCGNWRWRMAKWRLLMLWCAVPVTLGVAEAVFYLRKAAVLSATPVRKCARSAATSW
jgi:hypothetical protein